MNLFWCKRCPVLLLRKESSEAVSESHASHHMLQISTPKTPAPTLQAAKLLPDICCMFVSAVSPCIMSPHPKPKCNSGRSHWSEEQRANACSFYRAAFKRHYRNHPSKRDRSPTAEDLADALRGRCGDPVWSAAWHDYQLAQRKSEHRPLTSMRQYQKTVRAWLTRYSCGEGTSRGGTDRLCPLSQSELDLAERALSTPIKVGDSCIYFQTVGQCIEQSPLGPKLQELLARKNLRPQTLHRLLVKDLHILAYKKCDMREELAQTTLLQRRKTADVWARRKPWLFRSSPTRSNHLPVFFDWEWYFDYTFMIDAVSFEDGILSGGSSPNVYQSISNRYGPQLLKRKKGIASTSKMMFYVMIHRHGGIIAGPSLVFSGSKVPQHMATQKASILAPWCDLPFP